MKKINYLLLICLSIVVFIAGCKKKKSEEPAPTTLTPPNYICSGNGTNSYYPLTLSNSWTYSSKKDGVIQPETFTEKVKGYKTFGAYTYSVNVGRTDTTTSSYYREDAYYKDIYSYNTDTGTEYLLIPGTPVLNQSWPVKYGLTSKVTNLSATISTSSCTYTGLLEITDYNGSSVIMVKTYYKKGLGRVYTQSIFSGRTYEEFLSTVTLN
jgi:hypothetical protein